MSEGVGGRNPLEKPYEDLNAKDMLSHRRILAWIKLLLDGLGPDKAHETC